MGLGQQADRQNAMWISWDSIPKSRGRGLDRKKAKRRRYDGPSWSSAVSSTVWTAAAACLERRPPREILFFCASEHHYCTEVFFSD